MSKRTYHKARIASRNTRLRPGIWVCWTEKEGKAADIHHKDIPKGVKVIDETHKGANP